MLVSAYLSIGSYSALPFSEAKWNTGVANIVDTCTIKIPLSLCLDKTTPATEDLSQKNNNKIIFSEGDTISIAAGYNFNNELKFKGFVKSINFASVLEINCEGYSYQLNDVVFTKSYASTTIRQIVEDLTANTDIMLSDYIPDVTIENVTFKKASGMQVLEWFQKECMCSVFFDFDTLYVGASKFAIQKPTKKLQLGWNTVDDKNFKKKAAQTAIEINIVAKDAKGTVKRTKSESSKYSTVKDVKVRSGMADTFVKSLQSNLQKELDYNGYEGTIDCYMQPHFEKCDRVDVTSERYPEKNGSFFVENVSGGCTRSGFRQVLTLKHYSND